MSAADRLEDGFPHGTREGYDQGCRGSRCPATEEGWLSCAQARTRYQSDYAYRKRVDAGLSPAQLAEVHERAVAEQRAQLAAARARRDGVAAPVAVPALPQERVPAVDPAEASAIAEAEKSGIPYERHGLTSGYYAGCRAKEACPGIQRVGKSCTDAVNEYQRDLKARKKAAETPAVEQPVVERPEVVDTVTVAEFDIVRGHLVEQTERADRAEKEVAGLELKLTDALTRCTELEGALAESGQINLNQARRVVELRDRVASLEMELDVAKSKVSTFEPVAVADSVPLEVASDVVWPGAAETAAAVLEPMASKFRLIRLGDAVFVEVDGAAPGQVHFAFGEDGALSGVSVQSGK